MKRTTKIELNSAVRVLNQTVGANAVAYQPGSYILARGFGGWQLQKIVGSVLAQGVVSIFPGYRRKRELLELIHAFRMGIEVGEAQMASKVGAHYAN